MKILKRFFSLMKNTAELQGVETSLMLIGYITIKFVLGNCASEIDNVLISLVIIRVLP